MKFGFEDFINCRFTTTVMGLELISTIKKIYVNKSKKIVVVVFKDNTKQIVKCSPEDNFDTEIGFALAITRSLFDSKTQMRKFIASKSVITVDKPAKEKSEVKNNIKKSQKEEK